MHTWVSLSILMAISQYYNVSILEFIAAEDDGGGSDN